MNKFARLALPIALLMLLAACEKSQEAAPAPVVATPAPAPVVEPTVPTFEPATTPAPAVVDTTVAPLGEIGVAECDSYLKKYAACVAEKVPEATRAAIQQSMDATRQAWVEASKAPGGLEGMAVACQQATEAARASMAAYGCNDF